MVSPSWLHGIRPVDCDMDILSFLQVFQEHPLMRSYPPAFGLPGMEFTNPTDPHGPILNQPNTALMSFILMLGTFFVAYFLRKLRNSRFLGGKVTYRSHFL